MLLLPQCLIVEESQVLQVTTESTFFPEAALLILDAALKQETEQGKPENKRTAKIIFHFCCYNYKGTTKNHE